MEMDRPSLAVRALVILAAATAAAAASIPQGSGVEPAFAALPVDAGDRLRPGHAPSRVALDSARRGPLPVELSSMVATLEVIAGLVLCLIIFYDLFQSVVLPRPAVNKFALVRFVLRRIWVGWRWLGNRMSSISRRETWLAAFGPVGVLTMFGLWGLALVLGYSLLIDGLRDPIHPPPANFGTSLYFSATTLVPLSYGDLVPIGEEARFVIFAESATGVILATLAITLLFSLYGSFQAR